MTIRGLAADLGVAPMSLYRHVRDKEDLLDEVVDELLAAVWRPRVSERDPRAWVVEAADNLRRFLVNQPAALHVYLRRPVVSPAAVARMEAMLTVLQKITNDEAAARDAYAAVHTYTLGFGSLEASRAAHGSTDGGRAALAAQLAAYATPHQFSIGLAYLLDGILSAVKRGE